MSVKLINYVEWPAENGIIGQCCCDTAAELPAVNAFSSIGTLVATSTCRAINESTTYQLNTAGVWKKKTDATSVALDLTGYYTSAQTDSAISAALSDYYTDAQTDAAIAAALTGVFNFGKSPEVIQDNTNILDLPAGVYTRASNLAAISGLPSGFSSAFYLVVRLAFNNTWRRQFLLFPTSNTGTYNEILCFRCTENGTAGNIGPWVRFDGGTVL